MAPVWVGAKKFSMKDRYETTVLSSEQISKILPHRYPFLLVDRVVEFEAGKNILCFIKVVWDDLQRFILEYRGSL